MSDASLFTRLERRLATHGLCFVRCIAVGVHGPPGVVEDLRDTGELAADSAFATPSMGSPGTIAQAPPDAASGEYPTLEGASDPGTLRIAPPGTSFVSGAGGANQGPGRLVLTQVMPAQPTAGGGGILEAIESFFTGVGDEIVGGLGSLLGVDFGDDAAKFSSSQAAFSAVYKTSVDTLVVINRGGGWTEFTPDGQVVSSGGPTDLPPPAAPAGTTVPGYDAPDEPAAVVPAILREEAFTSATQPVLASFQPDAGPLVSDPSIDSTVAPDHPDLALARKLSGLYPDAPAPYDAVGGTVVVTLPDGSWIQFDPNKGPYGYQQVASGGPQDARPPDMYSYLGPDNQDDVYADPAEGRLLRKRGGQDDTPVALDSPGNRQLERLDRESDDGAPLTPLDLTGAADLFVLPGGLSDPSLLGDVEKRVGQSVPAGRFGIDQVDAAIQQAAQQTYVDAVANAPGEMGAGDPSKTLNVNLPPPSPSFASKLAGIYGGDAYTGDADASATSASSFFDMLWSKVDATAAPPADTTAADRAAIFGEDDDSETEYDDDYGYDTSSEDEMVRQGILPPSSRQQAEMLKRLLEERDAFYRNLPQLPAPLGNLPQQFGDPINYQQTTPDFRGVEGPVRGVVHNDAEAFAVGASNMRDAFINVAANLPRLPGQIVTSLGGSPWDANTADTLASLAPFTVGQELGAFVDGVSTLQDIRAADSLGELPAGAADLVSDAAEEVAAGEEAAATATADVRKFSDYIFKEGADHGKDAVFESLGYSQADSATLAEMWEEEAAAKFEAGDYTLGKLDQYGQRINIEIEVPGVGDAAGKVSYMRSGWMIQPDGTIKLNTPFTGFTR